MKTTSLFLLLALLFLSSFSIAQTDTNSNQNARLEYRDFHPGKGYYYNGNLINVNKVPGYVKSNPEAYKLAKSANGSGGLSMVLGYVGGFLIGWPLGTAIGGGEPEWAMAGVGAAIIAIAIPVASSADKKMQRAVEIYNEGLQTPPPPIASYKLEITGSSDGVGLRLRF